MEAAGGRAMTRTPQNSKRSSRSNAYSESKCSNWGRFDPYRGERFSIPPDLAPVSTFRINESESCGIHELPLHPAFVRPFGAADVATVLDRVPREFLSGLSAIYLMSGTSKQDKVAFGNLYRYGDYWSGTICLYAFPRRCLEWRRKGPPKPDIAQEYRRAGAVFAQDGDHWICRFDSHALKAFYLRDVLIHEIGHHVDRDPPQPFRRGKPMPQSERFAEWFVREYRPRGR